MKCTLFLSEATSSKLRSTDIQCSPRGQAVKCTLFLSEATAVSCALSPPRGQAVNCTLFLSEATAVSCALSPPRGQAVKCTLFLSEATAVSCALSPPRGQTESDREQRDHGRRLREKETGGDRPRGREETRKRQRHHYEFDKFMRRKEETKWGKGYCQDRAKKEGLQHHAYPPCPDAGAEKPPKGAREDAASRKERIRNKVSPCGGGACCAA